MKYLIIIGGLIAVLVLTFFVIESRDSVNQETIQKWAAKRGVVVTRVESQYTILGSPFFYVNKGNLIYRLTVKSTESTEIWWFRPRALFTQDEFVKEE